jgi:hypothetical protein
MTCGFISKQFGSCCFVAFAVVFSERACHVLRPASARCRACSRFVVVVLHVGLESVSVCLWYVIYQRNSRQSDDALPIGLPQSDYLAHLVDYVYDSLRRFVHRLSCCRFWTRRSNSVPRDESPASCERCTTMQLASCKGSTFYQTLPLARRIAASKPMQATLCDSWPCVPSR